MKCEHVTWNSGHKSVPLSNCGGRVTPRLLSVSRANGTDRELEWVIFYRTSVQYSVLQSVSAYDEWTLYQCYVKLHILPRRKHVLSRDNHCFGILRSVNHIFNRLFAAFYGFHHNGLFLKTGPIGCPGTPATYYQPNLPKIPEEGRSHTKPRKSLSLKKSVV
jgi:hypothetical protein